MPASQRPALLDHARDARLSRRGRLLLFVEACHAVQRLHTVGTVRGDLTPAAFVVDAGRVAIEPATPASVADPIAVAALSPEQASATPDTDTRTDVYVLGSLLVELLTGRPPFLPSELVAAALVPLKGAIGATATPPDAMVYGVLTGAVPLPTADLRATAVAEMMRVVREQEPPVWQHRRLPRGLARIAAACLAKDRDRRYPTADAVAADVRRYLGRRPLEIVPPSRLRRVLRSRAVAVAACLAFVAAAATAGKASHDLAAARELLACTQRQLAKERSNPPRDRVIRAVAFDAPPPPDVPQADAPPPAPLMPPVLPPPPHMPPPIEPAFGGPAIPAPPG